MPCLAPQQGVRTQQREQLPAKLRKLFPEGDIIAATLGLDDILKMQNEVGVGGWEEDKEE